MTFIVEHVYLGDDRLIIVMPKSKSGLIQSKVKALVDSSVINFSAFEQFLTLNGGYLRDA